MDFVKDNWLEEDYIQLIQHLNNLAEQDFVKFQNKLIPTSIKIIGIRIPVLRQITKEITKGNFRSFLNVAKFNSYEEILLYGFVMCKEKDLSAFLGYLNNYLTYIENWAICDLVAGDAKIVKKNEKELFTYFKNLLNSKNPFVVRFAIVIFMKFYCKEEYLGFIYETCNSLKSDHYYINMGIAWLISELYIKFPVQTKQYIENCNLEKFTKNKAIQKICESFRVNEEDKKYLKTLKI